MGDEQAIRQSGERRPGNYWRVAGEVVVTGLRIIAAAIALFGALKGSGLL